MTQIKQCPDCGKTLVGYLACSCGWAIEEEKEAYDSQYRCYYHTLGERCRNEGTICKTLRGSQGKWFCIEHWYNADIGG